MISYHITRRNPSSDKKKNTGQLFRDFEDQRREPTIGAPINLHNVALLENHRDKPGIHPIGMGKIPYVLWLNEHVYPKFPKGTKVTLATLPFVLGTPPPIYFEVIDIQELHYSAQYDRETRQPKCIAIRQLGGRLTSSIPIYYPPAALRVLQPEEVEAVDRLRNQESERRDSQNSGLDGTESSADRSTGESSSS